MNMKEQLTITMLKGFSTAKLLDLWETTNVKDHSMENAMVRGWLMDEIESRNPSGFDAWLDNDMPMDDELRDYIMGRKCEHVR